MFRRLLNQRRCVDKEKERKSANKLSLYHVAKSLQSYIGVQDVISSANMSGSGRLELVMLAFHT